MSQSDDLNSHIFHISLYDLAFLGTIFTGLTIALLLGLVSSTNRVTNQILALVLLVMVLYLARILAMDIRAATSLPQFSLALGPLLYFYVLELTQPGHKFCWKDFLPGRARLLSARNSPGLNAISNQRARSFMKLCSFVARIARR